MTDDPKDPRLAPGGSNLEDPVTRGGQPFGTSNPDLDQGNLVSSGTNVSDPVTGPSGGSSTSNKDHDIQALRSSEQRNLAISILLALFHLALALLVDCLELVNLLLAILHGLNAGFTYRTLQATSDPVTGDEGSTSNKDHDTGG